jgi:hypothetical protein
MIFESLLLLLTPGTCENEKRSSASSNILRYIWGSALATIFLTTILSFWLLSGSWERGKARITMLPSSIFSPGTAGL